MTITEADTERKHLVDIAADHAATFWYKLRYPQEYQSVRVVQGHQVLVIIRDYSLNDVIESAAEVMLSETAADR